MCFRRFTGQLAAHAKSVVAVDFMEKFIEKNKTANFHCSNIKFMCADVTKLDLPKNKYVYFGTLNLLTLSKFL